MNIRTGTTWTNQPSPRGMNGMHGMGLSILEVPTDTSILGRAKEALARGAQMSCASPVVALPGLGVPSLNPFYYTDYCKWNREHADLLAAQAEGKLDLTGVTLPPPPAAPDANDPRLRLPYGGDSLDEELLSQTRTNTRDWLTHWFDAIGTDPDTEPDPAAKPGVSPLIWLALGGAALFMMSKR
jgi:hypothetical protein